MSKNEQPAQGSLESTALTFWCENLSARHGPQMIANELDNYPGDPDFDETDLALTTRFYWRLSMEARQGPVDERKDAYFGLFGLTDSSEFPKLAARARQAYATAPMPVDVSRYFAE